MYLKKIDKENMLSFLMSFPEQCYDAIKIGECINIDNSYKKKYSNIIFTGMGGSAIGADLIKNVIEDEIAIPIIVNRNYTLPNFVNKDSLLFVVSYSGNTEETLSAYKEGLKRRAKIILITSGGKLEILAIKNRHILISIPKGYPPRCALGYSFIPLVISLYKLGLIKNKKKTIQKALDLLKLLRNEVNPDNKKNLAEKIAKKIQGKIPVIYTSDKLSSISTRWRGQFEENSKNLASSFIFPEMNHNEIVGWEHPKKGLKNIIALILKNKDDHPRIKRRMEITESLLSKENFKVLCIEAKGKTLLENILYLIYLGDFVSLYLAFINGADPTPVKRIEKLKELMGGKA
jgi:glucose/mannose-6-phosphate isomerase